MLDLQCIDENSPWSFQLGENNRLITCFLKQKLIIKTSNTPHQPSSTGHWCTLLGELGVVHLVLTKPIAKAKLRRWNWNQDCINLDTRRATKAGKTQENWPKKRRQRKRKWGGGPEVRYAWQVPWEVVVKWDWIRIWCVSEKLGKANNPWKTLKQGKNQNTDLTHFITMDPGLLSRPH